MSSSMQHLVVICSIIEMLFAIPSGMILKRMGFSSWWALLCFVPVVALCWLAWLSSSTLLFELDGGLAGSTCAKATGANAKLAAEMPRRQRRLI